MCLIELFNVRKCKGTTLVEILVVSGILLVILYIIFTCLFPAFRHFEKSQKESSLISIVQNAIYTISRELKYSDISGVTIIPGTHIYTVDKKEYPKYSLAFCSLLDRDGKYTWDDQGNPYWQKLGIFYLEVPEGALWYQENIISPSTTVTRPAASFVPRHGTASDRDRLIAKGIFGLYFSDSSGAEGITVPTGNFIRIKVTGFDDKQSFNLETCIRTQVTRF
ncbi:MAG: type II secretion system protein [Vulcanimicrobiota bacterium]